MALNYFKKRPLHVRLRRDGRLIGPSIKGQNELSTAYFAIGLLPKFTTKRVKNLLLLSRGNVANRR